MTITDVRGKKVTVAGLGRFGGGIEVAKWLVEQGASVLVTDKAPAKLTKAAFNANGHGAIVSASRSILYAHRDVKHASAASWQDAVADAVIAMRSELSLIRPKQ